ncbi:unnamed protein product [Nippostrongylus brasiliensis]|uniref:C-type lectin domain-containing protein n=1 Tax=Nippostrongylus brasiliensis TaxID=27835 RepID=A0A158R3J5_NIPBR|nr:unnamed protein product [Nippostrongylus brasiliensis]
MQGFIIAAVLLLSLCGEHTAAFDKEKRKHEKEGWKFLKTANKFFKAFTIPASQPEAKSRCEDLGGLLAAIHSREENDFITSDLRVIVVAEYQNSLEEKAVEYQVFTEVSILELPLANFVHYLKAMDGCLSSSERGTSVSASHHNVVSAVCEIDDVDRKSVGDEFSETQSSDFTTRGSAAVNSLGEMATSSNVVRVLEEDLLHRKAVPAMVQSQTNSLDEHHDTGWVILAEFPAADRIQLAVTVVAH